MSRKRSRESWQERNKNRMNQLSARQYSMGLYLDSLPSRVISYEVLDGLNQGTVRSFLIREYLQEVEVRGKRVVYWNKSGSKAVADFPNHAFDRTPTTKFSSLLSLQLYDKGTE